MGKAGAARKLAVRRRVRRGRAVACSAPRSTACCGPRPSSARRAIGETHEPAAGRHRLVRPRPPGPGAQDRAARRLQRGRVRRRPRRGDARARCSASGVAERADRRVYLREFAVVGAQSSRPATPGRAGAADRARRRGDPDRRQRRHPPRAARRPSVRHLSEAVRRLREAGVEVVVGTCPDLGTIKPIAPPLKQVARTWSRRLAAAQTIAVVEEGGRTVSLGSILGPGVRGGAGAALRAGPVPPVGGRLPLAGRGAAALDAGRARAGPRATRRSPRRCAARACCRSLAPPYGPSSTRAPSSTAPRSRASSSAVVAAG